MVDSVEGAKAGLGPSGRQAGLNFGYWPDVAGRFFCTAAVFQSRCYKLGLSRVPQKTKWPAKRLDGVWGALAVVVEGGYNGDREGAGCSGTGLVGTPPLGRNEGGTSQAGPRRGQRGVRLGPGTGQVLAKKRRK